jgi:hypothetical protein
MRMRAEQLQSAQARGTEIRPITEDLPMSKPKGLYRTTIEIWTDYDPRGCEIDYLA